LIRGRVQGVGFRWFVSRAARSRGLRGFVRNLPDGQVEVVACGDPGALEELESKLAEGPLPAAVRNVDKQEISHDISAYKSFDIK